MDLSKYHNIQITEMKGARSQTKKDISQKVELCYMQYRNKRSLQYELNSVAIQTAVKYWIPLDV